MTTTPSFTRTRVILLALGLGLLVAAILVGLGGSSSAKVADVDGHEIEKASFDRWLGVAARSNGLPAGKVPKAGDDGYVELRDQTMRMLISAAWIEREAADRDIEVTKRQVDRAYAEQRRRRYPRGEEFRRYLRRSGQTEKDIVERVRLDLLAGQIRADVVKDAGVAKVTGADIAEFHRRSPDRFRPPARRDLRVVVAKSRAAGERAEAALARGDSWPSVVRRFSTDPASRAQEGRLSITRGQQDGRLERAVFGAPEGQVAGPVKTRFGFHVFEVLDAERPARPTLEQATPQIRQLLESRRQQRALDAYVRDFRAEWRKRTACEKGYVVSECANARGR